MFTGSFPTEMIKCGRALLTYPLQVNKFAVHRFFPEKLIDYEYKAVSAPTSCHTSAKEPAEIV